MQKKKWKSVIAMLLSATLFLTGVSPAGMQVQAQDIISLHEDIVSSETEISEESGESTEMETVSEETLPGGTMNDGKITWNIDGNGKLSVTGEGDLDYNILFFYPWQEYKEEIYTAKISLTGANSLCDLFWGCKNLTSVDLSNLDTSNVTNMSDMFSGCASLETIDLSGLNTDNVTNMNGMFGGCASLETIDLSGLNTGNVTDMNSMFAGCISLRTISLGEWDVSKVANMGSMFARCNSLETLDFSNWNTQSLTSVNEMFKRCEALKTVKLSDWNTMNLSDAFAMFQECAALEKVDLSGWNTENMTKTSSMFFCCSDLMEVNMEGWTTENITDLRSMFSGCSSLKEIPMVISVGTNIEVGTSHKIKMSDMFADCNSLTKVDLSNSNIRNTDMGLMFARCQGLEEVNLQNSNLEYSDLTCMFGDCEKLISVNFSGVKATETDFGGIFQNLYGTNNCNKLEEVIFSNSDLQNAKPGGVFSGCGNLKTVDFSQCNTQGVTSMSSMFSGCTSLESIDLSQLNISDVTEMYGMFSGCTNLKEIKFNKQNMPKIENINSMFSGCSSLTSIDLSFISTSNVQNMSAVFSGCSGLVSLNLDGWDTSNVTDMSNMFNNCEVWRTWDSWKLDTGNVTNMSKMFADSNTLTEISAEDLKELDMSQVEDITGMFEHCDVLTKVDFHNLNTPNLKRAKDLFKDCPKLESLDLSGMDMSKFSFSSGGANNHRDMLKNCNALEIIYTPKNVPGGAYIKLPAQNGDVWFLSSGETTTIIPEDMVYQPVLQKNSIPDSGEDIWTPQDLVIEGIEINQKGIGYVKFHAISTNGQLLRNKPIYYYFEEVTQSGDVATQEVEVMYQSELSNAEGMVTIKTPELTNTTGEAEEVELKLHLFREISETEKENLGYTVLAKITVYPLSFTQNWEMGIRALGSVSIGPEIGVSIGVAELKGSLATMEIGGEVGGKLSVEHSMDKGERNLTLLQSYDTKVEAVGSAGLAADAKALGTGCDVDIASLEAGVSAGAVGGMGVEIEDYDPENEEHKAMIAGFMLASMAQANGDLLLLQLAELIGINLCNLEQTATSIGIASGAKIGSIDLGDFSEGSFETDWSLIATEGERSLSYEETKNKIDKNKEFAFSINNQKDFKLGALEYPTSWTEDLLSKPIDNTTEISAKVDPQNQVQEFSIRREVADSNGFICTKGTVDAIEITYDKETTNLLANEKDKSGNRTKNSELINNFITGDKHYFFGDTRNGLLNYLDHSIYKGNYTATHKDEVATDMEVEFGLKLGVGASAGIGVCGLESIEYEKANGTYSSGQVELSSEIAMDEAELEEQVKKKYISLLDLVLETLGLVDEKNLLIEEVTNFVDGITLGCAKVIQAGEEFVENTADWVVHIVSVNTEEEMEEVVTQSYEITTYAVSEEELMSAIEEGAIEEKKAFTIGNPYTVYVTNGSVNEGDNAEEKLVTDFTEKPLELTLSYTEEMLNTAGINEEEIGRIGIYEYSQEMLGYIYCGGIHDPENKTVTLTITKPGQFVLAVDATEPKVKEIWIEKGTKTPGIKVSFEENAGFLEFSLKIDGEECVSNTDWKNYYNASTKKIEYQVMEELCAGEHTLIIYASDMAGNAMSEPVIYPFVIAITPEEVPEQQPDELPEEVPDQQPDEIPEGLRYVFIDGMGEKNSEYVYTGKAVKPKLEIYDGNTLLTEKKDYTLSYGKNMNVGKAVITVKGKGNYGSKTTVEFDIVPKDISEENDLSVVITELSGIQNGKVQKPVPVIKYNNKKLSNKKDKDFVVTYPDNEEGAYKESGHYTVHIEGRGNYTGKRDIIFSIGEKKVTKLLVTKISPQEYTGKELKPEVIVKDGTNELIKGVHYHIEYKDNIQPGTARIEITGMVPYYTGTKAVIFKITGVPMKKVTVDNMPKKVYYTGEKQEPELTLSYEGQTLTKDIHYTVEYSDCKEKGKATAIITGMGKFHGVVKKNFSILPFEVNKDKNGHMKVQEGISIVYAKGGAKPQPEVRFKGELLIFGKDYTLSYANNKAVTTLETNKKPMIIVKFKGKYKGTLKKGFTILPQSLEALEVTGMDKVVSGKKKAWQSTVAIVDLDGKTLKAGIDYEKKLEYYLDEKCTIPAEADNYKEDTVIYVKVTGKGNYAGSRIVTNYRVTAQSITKAKVKIQDQTYTGKAVTITPEMIEYVKVNGLPLTAEQDYIIVPDSYKNHVEKGTATVQLEGKNGYGGRITVKYKIKQKDFLWTQIMKILLGTAFESDENSGI